MSERPHSSDPDHDFAASLIRAAKADAPRPGRKARAVAAASLAAAGLGAGGAVLGGAKKLGALSGLTWSAAGVIGAAAVVLALRSPSGPASTETLATATGAASHDAPAPLREELAPASPTPAPATQEPPSPATSATARAPVPRARASAPPPSDLSEQVAMLRRVRTDLAAGSFPSALATLDAYEQSFPRGDFLEEAEVLRVEVDVASGDHARAATDAAHFLAVHPDSVHAAKVRALVLPSARPSPPP